jgi:2-desacetyl-2-hydroxyethyl bacteriochlorophyllide A dehydrogenase
MKAAVLTAPEAIAVQEVATPAIKPHELLVKLKNCGICTLEQRLFSGEQTIHFPIIPGHEAAGEIVAVGRELEGRVAAGSRVALDLVTRCGQCTYCRSGHSNLCENRFLPGQPVLGGFGEYRAVRPSQIYLIPDSLSYAEACFAEPVACCIHSLKRLRLDLAEDLLVLGAGVMGLLHLQAGLCLGARVFVADPDRRRLGTAAALGAAAVIDPDREDTAESVAALTGGRGADACVVTSSDPGALEAACAAVGRTGRISLFTSYENHQPLLLDADTVHRNELLITGSEARTEPDFLQAVRLLAWGKIAVKPLISMQVSLTKVEAGMRAAMSRQTYRVLLDHEAAP